MKDRRSWSPWRSVAMLLFIAFFVFAVTYGLVSWYFPSKLSSETDDPAYVWLSMVLATSSPSWEWFRCNYSPLNFSISLTAHILLNVGAFFGMLWFALDAATNRGRLMKLENAVGLRDALIKTFVLRAVLPKLHAEDKGDLSASFDNAVELAGQEWEKQMTIVMGEKTAKDVAHLMKHPV